MDAVKQQIEKIESERYNSKDPNIIITDSDTKEDVIIKVLTSERTGAQIKFKETPFNSTEDLARKNFYNGVRTLNSWLFKNSSKYFDEAANLERDPCWQQRINLYKQLHLLLKGLIRTSPDKIIRSKGRFFEEVLSLLSKYDQLSQQEINYYRKIINELYGIAVKLDEGDSKTRTQQLFIRCLVSLFNNEYLAAYIWLFKIYLLNKEKFDALAEKDEILKKAIETLRVYIEAETGLNEELEELPTIASAYDLQSIFNDHLTTIYDINFESDTKERFSLPAFRAND